MATTHRILSTLLHIVGLASFANTFAFLHRVPTDISVAYGWYFQFLTILGILLSTVTFLLALAVDITSSKALIVAKNTLSLPVTALEILISFLYWSIAAYDYTLLAPPGMSIPLLADIGMHLTPAVVLLLDFLFFSPSTKHTTRRALLTSGTFAVLYWFWVEQCYRQNGWYPYPFFHLMTMGQRIVLFATSTGIVSGTIVILSQRNNTTFHKKLE